MLDLFGEIDVGGIKYNRSNFVDVLEYEVEKGYLEKGVEESDRKAIVNEIAQKLRENLKFKVLLNLISFSDLIKENIREKNIVVYMTNEKLQEKFSEYGLTGELKAAYSDYLMVVDANLGSLKTDPAVQRIIKYAVDETGGKLIAQLNIEYTHTGSLDWKTSHYRTYTRIYAPTGSKLINYQGAMADDTKAPGLVDISEDLGKTVFGVFLSINPGERKILSLTYELPADVADKDYSLILQKQPGNDFTNYEIRARDKTWQGPLVEDKLFQ
ncbi:MAG: hypothetical protein WC323_00935 [Patescibacteria group bacterium]